MAKLPVRPTYYVHTPTAGGKKEDKPAKPDGTEQDLHKSVPVFNIALALVTESLWKGQVGCNLPVYKLILY